MTYGMWMKFGATRIEVSGHASWGEALEDLMRLARDCGWTPPRWWQFWRWGESYWRWEPEMRRRAVELFLTANFGSALRPGYCCLIDDGGRACTRQAKFWVGTSDYDATHVCADHVEIVKCDGDSVHPL